MDIFKHIALMLRITRSRNILRRYFVVNGFDGALTMLGLIIGFLFSAPANLSIIINACLGAAIALGVSGVSSAYLSEVAERKNALVQLDKAMLSGDLQNSIHGDAARWIPFMVALVNGAAPLVISLLILLPLWAANAGIALPVAPLHGAIAVALVLVFALGVFIGRISESSWLRAGVQTTLVAAATAALIYLVIEN